MLEAITAILRLSPPPSYSMILVEIATRSDLFSVSMACRFSVDCSLLALISALKRYNPPLTGPGGRGEDGHHVAPTAAGAEGGQVGHRLSQQRGLLRGPSH